MVRAIECLSISKDEVEHHVEQLGDGDSARARDEGALRAVALGPPFVFDRDSAVNDSKRDIVGRVGIKEADQTAIEGRDRNCILDPRAAIRRAQLQRRVLQRRPDCPPV